MAKVKVQFRNGEIKDVPERDAKVLVVLGRASLVPEPPAPATSESKPAAKTPRKRSTKPGDQSTSKRVYRRRDLQAEE
jgi:hypothetical protein